MVILKLTLKNLSIDKYNIIKEQRKEVEVEEQIKEVIKEKEKIQGKK